MSVSSADASISRNSSGSHYEANDAGLPASIEIALVTDDAVDALIGCAACAARYPSPAVRRTDRSALPRDPMSWRNSSTRRQGISLVAEFTEQIAKRLLDGGQQLWRQIGAPPPDRR